ncbi:MULTISPECIES: hypothetical protein [Bacillaceae]|uniref:SPbeta prophage-derived uncharacterized protein YonU n=4 Tax=root TaxID=1 RepID=YONU_BACSU|nr:MULTISPECIES: hypothetical protein [Bacillales]NP_046620.1 hypothetical protein SPBc2p068 [Bacillus phage SPBc2]NP_389982.1 conserved protein of unknown function; phage SPbeta [Bacillus subtilis subsp. subtilis str. 168]O31940.1 RecName: Full=SPbeta prophage-derived uncharacterized protein YonU [Bacillus subtilis subsp. subtilis str. 168]MBW4823327.1 hypothetical protein [Bacillaceae bacterium]AAC13041.1 hypothetical protein [Bacillus phage SPBc2]AFQ58043.1 YonU [Bacillus subtilis QB928]A
MEKKFLDAIQQLTKELEMLKKDIDSIKEATVRIDKDLLEYREEISKVKQDDSVLIMQQHKDN